MFLGEQDLLHQSKINFQLQRLYPDGNHLVNPLIQVEGPPGGDARLESARRKLDSYIKDRLKNLDASSISVYLRDMETGRWVGIHEDKKYIAASLAKVPLMFSFFLKAQRDPEILKKEIRYETEIHEDKQQFIPPKNRPQVGASYTVETLLRNMIVYSDNISMYLLGNDIDRELVGHLYADLGLPLPLKGSEYRISAKDYARYFRLLYSAIYLNKDSSEQALKLLIQSDFHDGIVAGVPQNLLVAHKFAERERGVDGVQLHDCGIVYYPNRPYLICVMTEGQKLDTLKEIIQNISRIIYENQNFNSL